MTSRRQRFDPAPSANHSPNDALLDTSAKQMIPEPLARRLLGMTATAQAFKVCRVVRAAMRFGFDMVHA
ncbi:hypothetical protein JNE151685_21090 [Escherichia coli]|nr:hypothetical protein JNE151685_21090 [Escherichia coli]